MPPIPDYVIDGVSGRLFDVSDGLAGCVDALRQADEARYRMGEAARASVERQFWVDGVTRGISTCMSGSGSGWGRIGSSRLLKK